MAEIKVEVPVAEPVHTAVTPPAEVVNEVKIEEVKVEEPKTEEVKASEIKAEILSSLNRLKYLLTLI